MPTAPDTITGPPSPGRLASALVALLVMIPWLNPWAPGPSPSVAPWLIGLTCLALLWLARPWVRWDTVATAWLLAALVSALIGLLQYTGLSPAFAPWINPTAVGEAFGNLRQRNQFATLINIGLAALLWRCARSRLRSDLTSARVGVAPWWALAAAGLLGLACGLSASRTGLVQMALVMVIALRWRSGDVPLRRTLLATALGYLAAIALLPLVIGQAPLALGAVARMAAEDDACTSRLVLWHNVLTLIAQKPWFGWGWGELDYAHFITLYPGERFCAILDNAHNLPLHIAVELGVPAALVATLGVISWVARSRPWRERDTSRQLAWLVLLLIGLHSMLEYPLWYSPFFTATLLSLALLLRPAVASPRAWQSVVAGPAGRVLASVALLTATAYAAWDYRRISQIYLPQEQRLAPYRDNTLANIRDSWLFADQVDFAVLTTTVADRRNAAAVNLLATSLLHYSPEPAVIERLIESAVLLGRNEEALQILARYKAAFPAEHKAWNEANQRSAQAYQQLHKLPE